MPCQDLNGGLVHQHIQEGNFAEMLDVLPLPKVLLTFIFTSMILPLGHCSMSHQDLLLSSCSASVELDLIFEFGLSWHLGVANSYPVVKSFCKWGHLSAGGLEKRDSAGDPEPVSLWCYYKMKAPFAWSLQSETKATFDSILLESKFVHWLQNPNLPMAKSDHESFGF